MVQIPNPLSDEELASRFGFHKATIEGPEATQPRHILLRRAFLQFVGDLNRLLPPGRYTSLAMTAFEEAAMWSHKAVAQYAPLIDDEGVEDHGSDTLHKVFGAMVENGIKGEEAREIINTMQNRGILFREKTPAYADGALKTLEERLKRGF